MGVGVGVCEIGRTFGKEKIVFPLSVKDSLHCLRDPRL